MEKTAFTPRKGRTFDLASGRLLIADPHCLGYSPKDYTNLINTRRPNNLVYFASGALFHYHEDSSWNVYLSGPGLLLIKDTADKSQTRSNKKNKHLLYESPATFNRAVKDELRKEGFLFTATMDLSMLLVGDAEKYVLPESERGVTLPDAFDEFNISDAAVQAYLRSMKRSTNTNSNQIATIPRGTYTCKKESNRLFILPKF